MGALFGHRQLRRWQFDWAKRPGRLKKVMIIEEVP
jgi:hypothetical protein